TAVATTSGAVVSGIAPGTSLISYVLPSGCARSKIVTVNAAPTVIEGPSNICAGSSAILTNSIAGGTWTVNNTSIISVNAITGVVTGIAAGTATATYQTSATCFVTKAITVNPILPITG